jgi:hypothetical protein
VNLHEILAMLRTERDRVERSIKVLERLEQQPKVWPWSKVEGSGRAKSRMRVNAPSLGSLEGTQARRRP